MSSRKLSNDTWKWLAGVGAGGSVALWGAELLPPLSGGELLAVLGAAAGVFLAWAILPPQEGRQGIAWERRRDVLRPAAAGCFLLGVVLSGSYVLLFNRLVVVDTQRLEEEKKDVKIRKIVGFTRKASAPPEVDALTLLQMAQYRPRNLWEEDSVDQAEASLVICCLAALLFLELGVGLGSELGLPRGNLPAVEAGEG